MLTDNTATETIEHCASFHKLNNGIDMSDVLSIIILICLNFINDEFDDLITFLCRPY